MRPDSAKALAIYVCASALARARGNVRNICASDTTVDNRRGAQLLLVASRVFLRLEGHIELADLDSLQDHVRVFVSTPSLKKHDGRRPVRSLRIPSARGEAAADSGCSCALPSCGVATATTADATSAKSSSASSSASASTGIAAEGKGKIVVAAIVRGGRADDEHHKRAID